MSCQRPRQVNFFVRQWRFVIMRVAISTLVLLFGVGATAGDKRADPLPKDAKQELGRLQGEWVLKSGEKSGKKLEANDETLVLEIKGAKWIFTGVEKGE